MKDRVELAAKFYKCHETARKFFGDEYQEKISPYKTIIRNHCTIHNIEVLEAVIELCNEERFQKGTLIMMFMAAAVELIELNENN